MLTPRRTRLPAKSLVFTKDDMILRDYSVNGIGVWHASESPMRQGETIKFGSLEYSVQWTRKLKEGLYRYGARWNSRSKKEVV